MGTGGKSPDTSLTLTHILVALAKGPLVVVVLSHRKVYHTIARPQFEIQCYVSDVIGESKL